MHTYACSMFFFFFFFKSGKSASFDCRKLSLFLLVLPLGDNLGRCCPEEEGCCSFSKDISSEDDAMLCNMGIEGTQDCMFVR